MFAKAKTRSAAPAPVQMTVTVVEAAKDKTHVDPKLKTLEKELKRSFAGHTHFKFKEKLSMTLPKAKSVAKRLQAGKPLVLTYLGDEKGMLRVQLNYDGAQSVMKVRNGGLWFYARRLPGKRALILALRARVRR